MTELQMEKISMMGMGTGILKPQPAHRIPADKAIRTSNSKGTINTNPPRKDCIAWLDKKTNQWIYREDYEKEQYLKYRNTVPINETPITLPEFIKQMW